MVFKNLFIFPLIYCLVLTFTFFLTYAWAVGLNHVPVTFPYISDTGSSQPESSLFTFSLIIAAIVLFLMAYFRKLGICQWAEINSKEKETTIQTLAKAALISGSVVCIGIIGVASVQVSTNLALHMLSAIILFSSAIVFIWVEVVISYLLCPELCNHITFRIRVFVALLVSVSTGITAVAGIIAWHAFDGDDITKWTDQFKGYIPHLYSSIGEWISVLGSNIFVFTYVPEMYRLRHTFVLVPPQVHVLDSSYSVDIDSTAPKGTNGDIHI